ncbi:T9SS type A sorting domain-containing protein [Brumimicrobium aurantiacum]|uniref:T9SS C-terminal target domain-containing protein n=1 Tax=Brumimicrobium aurantiacum TaxID=1737063 RepID=A0A3E1EXX9_9FLAO|nr:T9SS type A sorting domain-containing protein [Brumimicrobium aurantiacum]RFC54416.1 T9SS C-terminal target domain-containing protein [Brumimicrobium aurantiacum]
MKVKKVSQKKYFTKLLREVTIILVLSFISSLNQFYAQSYSHPIFDSLKIIPANPSPNDNVELVCFTTLSLSPAYLDSSKVNFQNNQIEVDLYYFLGNFMSDFVRVDTIDLGYYSANDYTLVAYAHSYMTGVPDFNKDTTFINFTVLREDVGLKTEKTFSKINLYPNPVKNQLHFTTHSNTNKLEVEIYDLTGKRVVSQQFNNTDKGKIQNSIDVSRLREGLYLCRFSRGGTVVTRKFVKE